MGEDVAASRAALAEAQARVAEAKDEEDFLRHAVEELTTLSPEEGEDAALDARRRFMQAAERIREDVSRALAALGSEGAEGMLRDAARWLDGVTDEAGDTLDQPRAALDRAQVELGEAEDGVTRALEALAFDAGELERVEERLFALRAQGRKHGVVPDELPRLASELAEKLEAIDASEGNLKSLADALAEAESRFEVAADALGAARAEAAEDLDAAMAKELAPLKLERATFSTELAEAEAGPEGRDRVDFTVATNPGAPAGPLNKIASGGELSRFLLALKVCLADSEGDQTMIFDEIDRGVGGATADAVGRRLEALAREAQVLVVTHSPQVAARAGHHWLVEKRTSGSTTLSDVTALKEAERVDEIARMLSGDKVTEEARGAAKALLAG